MKYKRGIINPELKLNMRERFLRVFQYKEVDHVPDVEFGYWEDTLVKWHKEGLPEYVIDNDTADKYFGFEAWYSYKVPVIIPFKEFEQKIFYEDERVVVVREPNGVICKKFKKGKGCSIPQYIEFPVKDWDTWEEYKARYDLDGIRLPDNIDELKEKWKNRDYPLGVNAGGYFGWARGLMGLQTLLKTFYRDPDLIRDMFRFRTEMMLKAVSLALKVAKIDYAHWWEDMCYNKGPMLSPRLFKEFMVPEYKKITSYLKDHGVWLNILDSDGNINDLVPLWLEAGINCLFPLERRAGVDPVELREKHGKKLLLMGGIDKFALIEGFKAIDKELERVKDLVEEGGYIPHVDHRVPPDVSYRNYLYYLEKKRKLIGLT